MADFSQLAHRVVQATIDATESAEPAEQPAGDSHAAEKQRDAPADEKQDDTSAQP
ncbi:MAG TPA: hypothetical protein VMD79_12545 [Solirubrobacteraceae bacterium]|nr:hypothetical protein [Solirubrobacteraceae bacterium]